MAPYRVCIEQDSQPTVIDQTNTHVSDARVHRITFPETRIDTQDGPVWIINGPAAALISIVNNGRREYHSDVPCFSA